MNQLDILANSLGFFRKQFIVIDPVRTRYCFHEEDYAFRERSSFYWVNYTIHPSPFQRIWVCFILFIFLVQGLGHFQLILPNPPSSHQSTQDGVDYISVMQAGLSSLKAGLKTIITILISFGGIILIIKRKNGLMSLTLLWISWRNWWSIFPTETSKWFAI